MATISEDGALILERNATCDIPCDWQIGGVEVVLDETWSALAQVREVPGGTVLLEFSSDDSSILLGEDTEIDGMNIRLVKDVDDMEALDFHLAQWDLLITDPDGKVHPLITRNPVHLDPGITEDGS